MAEELHMAARRMSAGKTPRPDGILNEVLSKVAREDPEAVLFLVNTCLKKMRFPSEWKDSTVQCIV